MLTAATTPSDTNIHTIQRIRSTATLAPTCERSNRQQQSGHRSGVLVWRASKGSNQWCKINGMWQHNGHASARTLPSNSRPVSSCLLMRPVSPADLRPDPSGLRLRPHADEQNLSQPAIPGQHQTSGAGSSEMSVSPPLSRILQSTCETLMWGCQHSIKVLVPDF